MTTASRRLSLERVHEAARTVDPVFLHTPQFVSELSGAVGVTAVLAHAERFRGAHVGTILCGGNVTTEQLRTWF